MYAFTGQSTNLHIVAGIFQLDNLYLAGKTPLLVGDMLDNFGDILPETSKISACLDMIGNSHLTWLSSDSLYSPWWIELEVESNSIPKYPPPPPGMERWSLTPKQVSINHSRPTLSLPVLWRPFILSAGGQKGRQATPGPYLGVTSLIADLPHGRGVCVWGGVRFDSHMSVLGRKKV